MEKTKCRYCWGRYAGSPEKCPLCGEPAAALDAAGVEARKPAIDRFCDDFLTRNPRYQITVRSYDLGYVTARKEWKTFSVLAFLFLCLFGLIPGIIYLMAKQFETRVATLKFRFDSKGNPIYVSQNSQLPILKRYWAETGGAPASAAPFVRRVKIAKRIKAAAIWVAVIGAFWALGAHQNAQYERMSAPEPSQQQSPAAPAAKKAHPKK